MTRPLRHALVAVPTVMAAALLALSTAGPSSAATNQHDDAARDTVVQSEAPGEYDAHPQKLGDIVGVVTRHAGDAVVITTSFRSVSANALTLVDRIVTPDTEYVAQYDGIFGSGTITLVDENGSPVECSGLSIKVSGKRDTAAVTVPRSCLGRPATVRTGSLSVVPETSGARGGSRLITPAFDDARRKGSIGNSVKLGPKVARH